MVCVSGFRRRVINEVNRNRRSRLPPVSQLVYVRCFGTPAQTIWRATGQHRLVDLRLDPVPQRDYISAVESARSRMSETKSGRRVWPSKEILRPIVKESGGLTLEIAAHQQTNAEGVSQ